MSSTSEEKLWVICPVCHKANPWGVKFCEHCWGAAIHQDNPLTSEEMAEVVRHREAYLRRRKRFKIASISLGVVALLLAIFFGFYYFSDVIVKPPQNVHSNSLPGEWAMFHRDLGHTGSSGDTGVIPQGTLKWAFQTGAPIQSSPAVANGAVFFGSQDYIFYALDAESGSKRWEFPTGSWVDSSPSVASGAVYFGSNDGRLYALNTQNGQKIWEFSTHFPVRSSPAITDKIIFFGSEDYNLYALDIATGKKLWDYDTRSPAVSPPAVANGVVYIGAADGYTYAFNALNGQRRLRFRTHYAVYAGPVVRDTTVYAVTTNGRLYAFDGMARTRLQEHEIRPFWVQLVVMGLPGIPAPPPQSGYLWITDLRGAVNSSPTISGDTLYVGLEHNLVAVDLNTQKKLWTFKTGGTVRSTPAIADNVVYFGSEDGKLYAVNATNGEKLWDFPTGGKIVSSPAIANGVVYVGSYDGKVYAIK